MMAGGLALMVLGVEPFAHLADAFTEPIDCLLASEAMPLLTQLTEGQIQIRN